MSAVEQMTTIALLSRLQKFAERCYMVAALDGLCAFIGSGRHHGRSTKKAGRKRKTDCP